MSGRHVSRRGLAGVALVVALTACGGDDDAPCQALCAAAGITIVDAFPLLSFDQPLFFAQAPGDSTRAFVVEQGGVVRVFANQPGAATSSAFLDVDARVTDAGGEMGLLGLAFDPGYAGNGYLYVNYNPNFDNSGSNPRRTQISRFSVTADPVVADPASETVLLSFDQPYDNHKGGWLGFGPDGKLYVAAGDGGSGGDPDNNAQNLDVLLGKILRIDADGSIPADNPFYGATPGRDEIWAYGLRNPFRDSFDRLTGDLIAADVGQAEREEVDVIVRGGNYGWRKFEGTRVYNASDPAPPGTIAPIYQYDHSGGRCAIIGGYVYRGTALPGYDGAYFFADLCTADVWARHGGVVRHVGVLPGNPTSFGEDLAGELYLTSTSGHVYKIVAR